ncbi:MAG: hypothetical protein O8C64_12840 [Candidatus Methanoperedens sp.]|nr:hypothetical protein [Candidatus Methanoperedens sp.]
MDRLLGSIINDYTLYKIIEGIIAIVEYDYYFAYYQKIFPCYSLQEKNNPKTAARGIFLIKAIPGFSPFI